MIFLRGLSLQPSHSISYWWLQSIHKLLLWRNRKENFFFFFLTLTRSQDNEEKKMWHLTLVNDDKDILEVDRATEGGSSFNEFPENIYWNEPGGLTG